MKAILEYWPSLVQGVWTTVWISLCTILFSALGSLILGPLRLSTRPWMRFASSLFIEIIRGPSALVWLFWVFYALPLLPGLPQFSAISSSILVLSLVGAAYGSEIVRAGIEAVHRGQTDACHALGLSKLQSLRKVILPQALSQIVPAYGSMARDMIKWTSIVSFLGVQDVLYVANNVRSQTYETVTVFCLLGALYWVLCLICGVAFDALEKTLPLNRALHAARASVRTAEVAMTPAGGAQ